MILSGMAADVKRDFIYRFDHNNGSTLSAGYHLSVTEPDGLFIVCASKMLRNAVPERFAATNKVVIIQFSRCDRDDCNAV